MTERIKARNKLDGYNVFYESFTAYDNRTYLIFNG